MRFALTGSHGLLGSSLAQNLRSQGITIVHIVRADTAPAGDAAWRPDGRPLALPGGIDAVVHLAGARIDRRWTPRVRREIVDSRVDFTRALCVALAALPRPPPLLLAASAIGFYGDRGGEAVDEDSPPGRGFFPDLVTAWESACAPAREAGIRVVNLRLGVVLSLRGGALARMRPLFRLGLGGPLGAGRQFLSWIHVEDAVGAMRHLLGSADARGAYNLTAPRPVPQRDFARALGRALRRPAFLPAPAFALRLAFGAMADEALLAGAQVLPRRLVESGFAFRHPDLEPALQDLVRRGPAEADA